MPKQVEFAVAVRELAQYGLKVEALDAERQELEMESVLLGLIFLLFLLVVALLVKKSTVLKVMEEVAYGGESRIK